MTDTLFDLDTCSPKTVCAPTDNASSAFGRRIEKFAQNGTKRAVAAIARWTRAVPLHAGHPILSEVFVGYWPESDDSVRHVVVRSDGEITVQFGSNTTDGVHVLEMARLADDGSLVDQIGNWFLPKSQCPVLDEARDPSELVFTSYHLERVVGRSTAWVLTRNLKNGGLSLHRAAEVIPMPTEFRKEAVGFVAPEIQAAILAPHLSVLREEVAALLSAPKNAPTVREIQAFFSRHAHMGPRHHDIGSLDEHFLAEEIGAIQPLFDLLHSSFTAEGWSGSVTLDAEWYGDELQVTVQAENVTLGVRAMREITIPADDVEQMAKWFSLEQRPTAAAAVCATVDQSAPVISSETTPSVPAKKRRLKPAKLDSERVQGLRTTIAELAAVMSGEEQASLQAFAAALAAPGLTVECFETTLQAVDAIAQRAVARTLDEIRSVDSIIEWDATILGSSRDLAEAIRAFREAGVFSYAEGVNEFLALTAAALRPLEIAEVAPAWFVSRGSDGAWHGAASSTGYYSGCGSKPSEAPFAEAATAMVAEHLCQGNPPSVVASIDQDEKSGNIPVELGAWLRRQKQQPDADAVRQAGRLVLAAREIDSIAAALPRVAEELTSPTMDTPTAQALHAKLQCAHVADLRWVALATIASATLEKRFGVKTEKKQIEQTSLLADDANSTDDDDGCDDDEAAADGRDDDEALSED